LCASNVVYNVQPITYVPKTLQTHPVSPLLLEFLLIQRKMIERMYKSTLKKMVLVIN